MIYYKKCSLHDLLEYIALENRIFPAVKRSQLQIYERAKKLNEYGVSYVVYIDNQIGGGYLFIAMTKKKKWHLFQQFRY